MSVSMSASTALLLLLLLVLDSSSMCRAFRSQHQCCTRMNRMPSLTPLSSSSPDMSNPAHTKRQKVNKYEKFSTRAVDPLETAMVKQKKEAQRAAVGDGPVRGTTVPVMDWASSEAAEATEAPVSGRERGRERARERKDAAEGEGETVVLDKNENQNKNQTKNIIPSEGLESIVPSDPFTFGYTKIGNVIGPHGVKGELKLNLETDFADLRLSPGSVLYVRKPNRLSPRPIRVVRGRRQVGNVYLVVLQNVNSRLAAAAFRSYGVYVKSDDRPPLEENEYLVRDLVGMKCYREETDIDPLCTVVGVVPPDELCAGSLAASLMHSILEVRIHGSKQLCLVPLVPQVCILHICSYRLHMAGYIVGL